MFCFVILAQCCNERAALQVPEAGEWKHLTCILLLMTALHLIGVFSLQSQKGTLCFWGFFLAVSTHFASIFVIGSDVVPSFLCIKV